MLLLLCAGISYAQEKESDCDSKFNEALTYLKEDKSSEDNQEPAIKLLKPCAENGHIYAKVLLAKIYEKSKDELDHQKAFKLYKEASKEGNSIAMANLAVLYKYGKGCKLNYNKARQWFKKSSDQGNHKATYSLGYLYLKGFGSIEQNYKKAIQYFEKSEYPMAKYWLGVCYLNGYGVDKNTSKANELLGANFSNTTSIGKSISNSNDVSNKLESLNNTEINTSHSSFKEEDLVGKWKGKLIQLDWSKKDIVNKIDFEISLKKDENTGTLISSVVTNNQIINDDVLLLDNTLYFDGTKLVLPHRSYNDFIPSQLAHNLLSADLQLKSFEGNDYLTANIDSYIQEWNETGVPTRIILKKIIGFENSNEELTDDALKALSEQEESFIKLYPNPFVNDLIVSYSLKEQANVQVQITDLTGNYTSILESEKLQNKGKHRYFFNASPLKEGAYIVSVIVNGERKTRLIVKK